MGERGGEEEREDPVSIVWMPRLLSMRYKSGAEEIDPASPSTDPALAENGSVPFKLSSEKINGKHSTLAQFSDLFHGAWRSQPRTSSAHPIRPVCSHVSRHREGLQNTRLKPSHHPRGAMGNHKVLRKGTLPRHPIIMKDKLFSRRAEGMKVVGNTRIPLLGIPLHHILNSIKKKKEEEEEDDEEEEEEEEEEENQFLNAGITDDRARRNNCAIVSNTLKEDVRVARAANEFQEADDSPVHLSIVYSSVSMVPSIPFCAGWRSPEPLEKLFGWALVTVSHDLISLEDLVDVYLAFYRELGAAATKVYLVSSEPRIRCYHTVRDGDCRPGMRNKHPGRTGQRRIMDVTIAYLCLGCCAFCVSKGNKGSKEQKSGIPVGNRAVSYWEEQKLSRQRLPSAVGYPDPEMSSVTLQIRGGLLPGYGRLLPFATPESSSDEVTEVYGCLLRKAGCTPQQLRRAEGLQQGINNTEPHCVCGWREGTSRLTSANEKFLYHVRVTRYSLVMRKLPFESLTFQTEENTQLQMSLLPRSGAKSDDILGITMPGLL
ncbi:LOW QUALITY PROTEIN: hypothetical protein U0070_005299, partial [Myodes glareolus]